MITVGHVLPKVGKNLHLVLLPEPLEINLTQVDVNDAVAHAANVFTKRSLKFPNEL